MPNDVASYGINGSLLGQGLVSTLDEARLSSPILQLLSALLLRHAILAFSGRSTICFSVDQCGMPFNQSLLHVLQLLTVDSTRDCGAGLQELLIHSTL